jgi:serine protease inhibitor
MDYYRGVSMNVDFASPDAVAAVNRWARDNTNGLITEIVQKFDPDVRAAIANAIYFSDRWSWEFNPDNTQKDIFHSPVGETEAYYMRRNGSGRYYEDDTVQAMPLGFETGGGMYIILPKDGNATGLLSSMTNEDFEKIQRGLEIAKGRLLLPRFSIKGDVMQLTETLTALGIPLTDALASPIDGLIEDEAPLYVSSALHKAVIKVDEYGTTAAAVTEMEAASGSEGPPPPTKTFEMICDKPFVFVLYGDTVDNGSQILFTGMVNRP